MGDSKVETISRLAKWRVQNFRYYKLSDPFKVGIWNWHLYIENSRCLYIQLYLENSQVSKEQPPMAKFVLRFSNCQANRRPYMSPVYEELFDPGEYFQWSIDATLYGYFIIDVEFLDLKIYPPNGGEAASIWPSDGMTQSLATQGTLRYFSRMLHEAIHADVTIHTADDTLRVHKAILCASSPVFQSMFHHDLKEKASSTINIEDISKESCMAFLSCLYGAIKQEDFWKHRLTLLVAAHKYGVTELKDACEERLLEDINLGNVLERLQKAWLYQLDKLKKGCLKYLLDFGKIYDVWDEVMVFFRQDNRELVFEMLEQVLTVWKPM